MIEKNQLETFLRIQGVSPTSPDEVIRSILISAKFSDLEIETAFTVLRENKVDNTSSVEGLHKVFRSEKGLKPHEISQLLGIDMTIDDLRARENKQNNSGSGQYMAIIILTLIVAFLGIVFTMYQGQMGPFHSSVVHK